MGADAVPSVTTSAFDLPDNLTAKADPALIADDERHFAAIAESLRQTIAELTDRLEAERRSPGGIVVDGGPGTGKTVVALHRTAYLLYSDPPLGSHRGGVLFVGPSQPYLAYVADVLPSLGEEGVQICTLRDLVPEGAAARVEPDPEVARLKSSMDVGTAIETAVRFYEEPPTKGMTVTTDWSDIWLSADDWAEAFQAPGPGTPHNEARDQVWEALLTILTDKDDGDAPAELLRTSLQQ